MVTRTLAAAALALAALAPRGAAAEAPAQSISFTKERLPNGLTVIFHEDHTLPVAVVNVSYNVGSHVEAPKRTGFAHLFEHLMFMGTERAPTKAFDAWMEEAGGWNNAWTSEDRTDYFDVAPSSALPLLLWLEADRLRDLGATMTRDKLDAQRDVVRNERRQTSENRPYGRALLRLPELLYPDTHPYHHPVIGSHEDLEAATVADVREFFSTWYVASNASLVVAGDFDPKRAMDRIQAWFGTLPSRPKPAGVHAPELPPGELTTLKSVVRETLQDDVELSKTIMAWQSPKHFGPGDAELDLLSNVLAGGKASRLYKALVYEQKLAQDVEATQESGTLGSRFIVSATARPGVALDALEQAIDKELAAVRGAPVSDEELTRSKNVVEFAFVARLQSVRERASLLNAYEAELGDPGFFPKDLARYRGATKEGLRAIAERVLAPGARVVLRVVPAPPPPDAQRPRPHARAVSPSVPSSLRWGRR